MMKYKWTINLLITAPMILLCSVILSGGGHGFSDQLIVLFPWAAIAGIIDLGIIFFIFGLIQYPIYGFLYDTSNHKKKMIFLIMIVHFLIVIGILISKYK